MFLQRSVKPWASEQLKDEGVKSRRQVIVEMSNFSKRWDLGGMLEDREQRASAKQYRFHGRQLQFRVCCCTTYADIHFLHVVHSTWILVAASLSKHKKPAYAHRRDPGYVYWRWLALEMPKVRLGLFNSTKRSIIESHTSILAETLRNFKALIIGKHLKQET